MKTNPSPRVGLKNWLISGLLYAVLSLAAHASGNLQGYNNFNVSPSSAAAGQQVQVSLYVINASVQTAGAFTVRLYLTKNSTINPSTDYPLTGHIQFPSLGELAYYGGTVTIQLPNQDEIDSLGGPGTFTVGMVVDDQQQDGPSKYNEGIGKDLATVGISIPLPDLAGLQFSATTGVLTWGEICPINFAVQNLTGGDAAPFTVNFYLSQSQTISVTNYFLYSLNITNTLPGLYEYSGSFSFFLPQVNPFGSGNSNFYVGMVIDPNNQLAEVTKSNNSNLGNGVDRAPITIVNPQPHIQVTTSTPSNSVIVAFGNVANDGLGNAVGTQTVTVVDTGSGPLNITNIVLSGSPEFSIVQIASTIQSTISLSSLPRPIYQNGGESWVITLQFDPTVSVSTNAFLTILSNDPNSPTFAVPLTGIGVAVPQIALVSSAGVGTNFGNVIDDGPGGNQATATISFKNTGSGPVVVSKNGLFLLNGVNFGIVSITSSTQGAINLATASGSIAPGGTEIWNVVVRFDPVATGVLNDGLQVASNDPNQPNFVTALQGIGVTPMHLQVLDSTGSSNIVALVFSAVDAVGPGSQEATGTILLQNSGQAPLTVSQNGLICSNGANFIVQSIVSSTNGVIILTNGPANIAGNSMETWTVTLVFDPATNGALSDVLLITSNDPTNSPAKVALSGAGLYRANLAVSDSVPPTNDLTVPFGAVLADGIAVSQTVTLMNLGAAPLIAGQNGITLSGSPEFTISNIISSTRGLVNLASANAAIRTISPNQSELWTVTLLLNANSNGPSSSIMSIASNDTNKPVVQVALTGNGATPGITVTAPSLSLDVSAGDVYNFQWLYSAPDTNATISLYFDTDLNPSTGLIPIATGILAASADGTYSWHVDPSLVGTNYYVYATISDGPLTEGNYAAGTLKIDPTGAFQLESSSEVTSSNYGYQYLFDGQSYQGLTGLLPGANTVTVTNPLPSGGTSTFQFTVNLVSNLTQSASQQYNTISQLVQSVNGNGIITTYTYDPLGNLIKRFSSNGAVVTYTYDTLGHRSSMSDYTGTTYYQWDDLGRNTAVTTSKSSVLGGSDNLTISYGYDLAGNRTSIMYPNGETIQYSYDAAGRILTANNITKGLLFSYGYNPTSGQLASLSRPNGITTLYSYDGMGNVIDIHHQNTNGTLVADYSYGLDAAGKATNFVTVLPGGVIRQEVYAYDALDRLIRAVYSTNGLVTANSLTVSYTYDGNGNRLTMTTSAGSVITQTLYYQYGNENRLMSVVDQNGVMQGQYGYDAAGNRIQKVTSQKTTLYAYNERNLLTMVTDGTNQIVYAYNGDGERISRIVNGVLTTFVNDPNQQNFQTVQELNNNLQVTASYTYGGSRLASLSGSATSFELPDRLGSVRLLAGATGAVASSFSYDAFGAETVLAGSPYVYAFDGERQDPETGLSYLRARYYDPVSGSFISKDPLGVISGLNSYEFAQNQPINVVDPSGRDPLLITAGAGLVIGGLVGGIGGGITAALKHESISTGIITGAAGGATTGVIIGSGAFLIEAAELGWVGVFGANAALGGGGSAVGAVVKNTDANYINNQSWSSAQTSDVFTSAALGVVFSPVQSIASLADFNYQGALSDYSLSVLSPNPQPLVTQMALDNIYSSGAVNDFASALDKQVAPVVSEGVSDIYSLSQPSQLQNPTTLQLQSPLIGDFDNLTGDDVGGVLLDQAATLVGTNLSYFSGAMYDPKSGQFVFLGTNGPEAVSQLNLDYLYTALQAVYGSAVPPFVTLDPPAIPYSQWTVYGNSGGVFGPGQTGGFLLEYDPIWSGQDKQVKIQFAFNVNGQTTNVTAVMAAQLVPGFYSSGQEVMCLAFQGWQGTPPSGVEWTSPTSGGININGHYVGVDFENAPGQRSYFTSLYPIQLQNTGTQNIIVNSVNIIPDRQHREYGGRVEGTKLGWVMMEADRVMKCLAVGTDNLVTNIAYNSTTIHVPGYENMAERLAASGGQGGDIRFWFTPNQMTLQQDINPTNGRATVVFSSASVLLNTESYILGLPQPPEAAAFAAQFTSNYDAFASMSFPCVDPNDPAGTNIIEAPIFKMLQDVMKAVSLARFCRDNGVPVDMWWLNSWTPPTAYSLKSVPTAYDQNTGVLIYGGVQIYTPNAYIPSASAQDVADLVQSARAGDSNNVNSDIPQQVWTATNTPSGPLTAVAASTSSQPQSGNIRLTENDLKFASPGALPLQFARYYKSSWLGSQNMGAGWRYTPFVMEFQRPSWFDQTGLMLNTNGESVWTDVNYDTRLRSEAIRIADLRTGDVLDFNSSLVLNYAVNNTGNPIISLSGLNTNDVPMFSPGQRQSGAALVQEPNTLNYLFTAADGSQITFDSNGHLLSTEDRYGMTQVYNYNQNRILTNITDSAGQTLTMNYDTGTNFLTSVVGPANETIEYGYTNGCLVTATHVRSGATVTYQYNTNNQLIAKIHFNGINAFQSQPDLKGRPNVATDRRGNSYQKTYNQNADGSVRTNITVDPLNPTQPSQQQFDQNGRLMLAQAATGATTTYGYQGTSLRPNYVNLPIAGRPTITIQRNTNGQATQITDPGNVGAQNVTATYDPNSAQLTQFSDAAGRSTQLYYNGNRNISRIHRVHGTQSADTGFGYDAAGALHTMTNELGQNVATFNRDYLGRATNIVDATGVAKACDYDSLGRVSRIHDPRLSAPIVLSYDNFDRVTNVAFPTGSLSYQYDPVKGWLVSKTDILGRTTTYVHDPNTGDILQTINSIPGGQNLVTSMKYNRFGELTSVSPPGANTINFSYDGLGRATGSANVSMTPPGAPINLECNNATNGVPTSTINHIFTWGAPYSDTGIAGYSYGLDQAPNTNAVSASPNAAWNGTFLGTHTFQVMALGNNGFWGPVAEFNLVVVSIPPQLSIDLTGTNVILSWSTNAVGFSLQSATNLIPPIVWMNVSPAPVVIGSHYFVTNSAGTPTKYYRLSN